MNGNVDEIDDVEECCDSTDFMALHVGMVFESASSALHVVQDYALAQGRAVKVLQKSGMHRFIGCTSNDCKFGVRVYQRRRADKTYCHWHISSIDEEHVNCVSNANPTRRQIAGLPTFSSAVRSDCTISAGSLMSQVQARDGISLAKKRRTLYRARQQVNEVGEEELVRSYHKIPGYFTRFVELNPGSVALAERDSEGRFKRAIVFVKVFVAAAVARQDVVGVDCSHYKCPSYSGMQMHLVGRDGNLRNLTIAFGLVEAEDIENYVAGFSRYYCCSGAAVDFSVEEGLATLRVLSRLATLSSIRELIASVRQLLTNSKSN